MKTLYLPVLTILLSTMSFAQTTTNKAKNAADVQHMLAEEANQQSKIECLNLDKSLHLTDLQKRKALRVFLKCDLANLQRQQSGIADSTGGLQLVRDKEFAEILTPDQYSVYKSVASWRNQ